MLDQMSFTRFDRVISWVSQWSESADWTARCSVKTWLGALLAAVIGLSADEVAADQSEVTRSAPKSAFAPNADAQTVQSAVRRVFRLLVEFDGAVKGGTAFLVSGKRIIVTNHHVVEGGKAYSVGFVDENGLVKRIPLRRLAVFPQKDLALLEALDDLPGPPMPLSMNAPPVATDLFAIGFPAAADPRGGPSWAQSDDTTFFIPSVLKGYVSRVLTNRWFSSQLQHQTPIIPGYSGGPLINRSGVVLAVSTAIHQQATGISYGVLASDVVDFLSACGLPRRTADEAGRISRSQSPNEGLKLPEMTSAAMLEVPPELDTSDDEMLARGYSFLDRGDIVAARLVFRYLVDRRHVKEAYDGLGKTYDPLYLNKKKVIGVLGDAAKARGFYAKAAGTRGLTRGARRNAPVTQTGQCTESICSLVNGVDGPTVVCQQDAPDPSGRVRARP